MIDEHREATDAVAAATQDRNPDPAPVPAAKDTMSKDTPRDGEIQESVDPFDYAETIVRDLAVHVGSRLRDFRADLSAMHSAVVSLPETMKINALGQSIHELRERVAHLTGVVSHHAARPAEEMDRLNRAVAEMGQRLAEVGQRLGMVEAWLAKARAAGGVELPELPAPPVEQFDKIVDELHGSILKIVGAVRELQLDLRDLRIEVRNRPAGEAKAAAAPAPAPTAPAAPAADHGPQLRRLADQLVELDGRLARLSHQVDGVAAAAAQAPAAVEAAPPPAAPPPDDDVPGLASLVFGSWSRLVQPAGPEALRIAVEEVVAGLARGLREQVRAPQLPRGPGVVAVMGGRVDGRLVTAILAVEDLCGRSWTAGAELTAGDGEKPASRQPCWRGAVSAAVLAEQARPGSFAVPVVIYGNGQVSAAPSAEEVAAHAAALGAPEMGRRLIAVAASDLELPGLVRPNQVAGTLVRML